MPFGCGWNIPVGHYLPLANYVSATLQRAALAQKHIDFGIRFAYVIAYTHKGGHMTTLTATEARRQLYNLLDDVSDSHEPIQITGKRHSAILISETDWKAVQETLYLSVWVERLCEWRPESTWRFEAKDKVYQPYPCSFLRVFHPSYQGNLKRDKSLPFLQVFHCTSSSLFWFATSSPPVFCIREGLQRVNSMQHPQAKKQGFLRRV